MEELHAVFKGRVQGVGFRWTVVEYAEKHHLVGTTQNLSNGTVEVFAQGTRDNLDAFLTDIKKHSGFARIDSVQAHFQSPTNTHFNFQII